jgi:hypothetical protein
LIEKDGESTTIDERVGVGESNIGPNVRNVDWHVVCDSTERGLSFWAWSVVL